MVAQATGLQILQQGIYRIDANLTIDGPISEIIMTIFVGGVVGQFVAVESIVLADTQEISLSLSEIRQCNVNESIMIYLNNNIAPNNYNISAWSLVAVRIA